MADGDVIAVAGAVKRYGKVRALDGLDLHVRRGEVHGFLGPNGAGKSTAIRLLLGLIRADGGTARMLGGDPWHDAVRLHKRVAYVPGDVALWPNLTGGQVIDVLTGLRGTLREPRRDRLAERFDLDPSKRCRTYSKGNRQKVALVAAFAGDAELLLLDEPTSGLDPVMEEVFTDCVAEAAARGATVLLSSHVLAEVERLADRITIIRAGRAVRTGSLAQLQELARVDVDARTRTAVRLPSGCAARVSADGRHIRVSVAPGQLDGLTTALASAGIESMAVRPPSLEEIFLEQYRRQGR
ncbi:MAG: ABC transporter ATP-binding protein [Bifidobacteriaceae bacterium]|jgi:ABC-2 type transport system ATP-binding protein|nr:ABC transporter ATP-binding protein [Bifidobacteriaceae bacterium]